MSFTFPIERDTSNVLLQINKTIQDLEYQALIQIIF